jgi:hypothetical protein
LEGWSWRSEDFSFGAVPIGWRMEKHRARWSLPRWLLACLRLYVSTDEIFCISFKDIQTTKVQTFTSLRPSCHKLSILPPTNVTSHTTCITIALPHPPHHTPPHLRQYHPTRTYMQQPSPQHVILSLYLNVYRKNPPSPSFGPVPEGWECTRTLVLYHAPLIQP